MVHVYNMLGVTLWLNQLIMHSCVNNESLSHGIHQRMAQTKASCDVHGLIHGYCTIIYFLKTDVLRLGR